MAVISPRGELSVRSTDEGHVIAAYNPLIIVCFTRAPRSEELQLMSGLAAAGLEEGIRGGLLYVVARKDLARGVDPEVRSTIEGMTRDNAGRSGANAVVVLTEGFGGAIVRGVLAGLVMLARDRRLIQVFGDADEACAWLAQAHELERGGLARAYGKATAHLSMPRLSRPPRAR